MKNVNKVNPNTIAINKSLSPLLQVEPLQQGQTAVYKLVNAGKYNKNIKRPTFAAGHVLTGKSSIYDPGDSGNKIIENIQSYTRVETEDGKSYMKPSIARVIFDKKNVITLTSEDNNMYAFMERHPANRSNVYRPKKTKAVFFRVEEQKSKKWEMDTDLLMLDAMNFVRDANTEELAPVAEEFNLSQTATLEDWKADLLKKSKVKPERVLRASTNAYLKHKVLLRDAIEVKFIFFDTRDRVWRWQIDGEHVKKGEVLCKVNADEEAFDKLINHIQENKQGFADKREIEHLLTLGVGV